MNTGTIGVGIALLSIGTFVFIGVKRGCIQ